MTHDDPRHRTPPRAEPLQPDRPTRGADKESVDDGRAPAKGEQANPAPSAKKLKQQVEDAHDNVSKGYGGD